MAGLSGCGGGGGRYVPSPSLPPQVPTCVETADFGCIEPVAYRQRRDGLARNYRAVDGFSNQWGLHAIRADVAYADLVLRYGHPITPGQGQTVGIIDTGIDQDHPVFEGKTLFEQYLSGAVDETGARQSHGTTVASVIAGNPSAVDIRAYQAAKGVAPGADIAMFAIPLGTDGGPYRPVPVTAFNSVDHSLTARFGDVIDWSRAGRRLDFVNMSFGYTGLIEQYSARDLRANLTRTISTFAQDGRAEKTVFIWSAGNAHGDRCEAADFVGAAHLCPNGRVDARAPGILPGLPARLPELRGHMIAVAAVAQDSDGDGAHEIAAFSNRCGIAADWCLAAPGQEVRAAYFGPHPETDRAGVRGAWSPSGTSFAAPMVTGSLVVMKHAFRDQLSNTELVTRLLSTANNRGVYADRDIYGRGLLDLGAALTPAGLTSVALGDHVEGSDIALAETTFRPGGAFGNGPAHGLLGQDLVVFDTLGAPFWLTLDTVVRQAAPASPKVRLRDFMATSGGADTFGTLQPDMVMLRDSAGISGTGWYLGQQQRSATGRGGGHVSLAEQALTFGMQPTSAFDIAVFSTQGTAPAPVSGGTLSWRPSGLPVGFRSGLLKEPRSILGSQMSGAFGSASARSLFAGVDWQGQFKRWTLHADAEIGRADSTVRGGGLIEDVSPVVSSAFALHANRPFGKGTFGVTLVQPLRVETGTARLSVPVGRTTDGQVLRRDLTTGLAPDGRQIDIAAHWNRSFGTGSMVRLGAVWSRHPGHDAGASPVTTVLANWQIKF